MYLYLHTSGYGLIYISLSTQAVKDCGNNTKKLETYTEIMGKFKPVFRHFFFENFKEAGTYFERRLAYTRR